MVINQSLDGNLPIKKCAYSETKQWYLWVTEGVTCRLILVIKQGGSHLICKPTISVGPGCWMVPKVNIKQLNKQLYMYIDISPTLVISIPICNVRNNQFVNLFFNSLNQKVKVRLSLATKRMVDTETPPLTPPTIQTGLTNQMWRWLLVLRCLILPHLPLNYLPTCRPCRGAGA